MNLLFSLVLSDSPSRFHSSFISRVNFSKDFSFKYFPRPCSRNSLFSSFFFNSLSNFLVLTWQNFSLCTLKCLSVFFVSSFSCFSSTFFSSVRHVLFFSSPPFSSPRSVYHLPASVPTFFSLPLFPSVSITCRESSISWSPCSLSLSSLLQHVSFFMHFPQFTLQVNSKINKTKLSKNYLIVAASAFSVSSSSFFSKKRKSYNTNLAELRNSYDILNALLYNTQCEEGERSEEGEGGREKSVRYNLILRDGVDATLIITALTRIAHDVKKSKQLIEVDYNMQGKTGNKNSYDARIVIKNSESNINKNSKNNNISNNTSCSSINNSSKNLYVTKEKPTLEELKNNAYFIAFVQILHKLLLLQAHAGTSSASSYSSSSSLSSSSSSFQIDKTVEFFDKKNKQLFPFSSYSSPIEKNGAYNSPDFSSNKKDVQIYSNYTTSFPSSSFLSPNSPASFCSSSLSINDSSLLSSSISSLSRDTNLNNFILHLNAKETCNALRSLMDLQLYQMASLFLNYYVVKNYSPPTFFFKHETFNNKNEKCYNNNDAHSNKNVAYNNKNDANNNNKEYAIKDIAMLLHNCAKLYSINKQFVDTEFICGIALDMFDVEKYYQFLCNKKSSKKEDGNDIDNEKRKMQLDKTKYFNDNNKNIAHRYDDNYNFDNKKQNILFLSEDNYKSSSSKLYNKKRKKEKNIYSLNLKKITKAEKEKEKEEENIRIKKYESVNIYKCVDISNALWSLATMHIDDDFIWENISFILLYEFLNNTTFYNKNASDNNNLYINNIINNNTLDNSLYLNRNDTNSMHKKEETNNDLNKKSFLKELKKEPYNINEMKIKNYFFDETSKINSNFRSIENDTQIEMLNKIKSNKIYVINNNLNNNNNNKINNNKKNINTYNNKNKIDKSNKNIKERTLQEINAQELSNISWAYAATKQSQKHKNVMFFLSKFCLKSLSSFTSQGLANIAWSFSFIHNNANTNHNYNINNINILNKKSHSNINYHNIPKLFNNKIDNNYHHPHHYIDNNFDYLSMNNKMYNINSEYVDSVFSNNKSRSTLSLSSASFCSSPYSLSTYNKTFSYSFLSSNLSKEEEEELCVSIEDLYEGISKQFLLKNQLFALNHICALAYAYATLRNKLRNRKIDNIFFCKLASCLLYRIKELNNYNLTLCTYSFSIALDNCYDFLSIQSDKCLTNDQNDSCYNDIKSKDKNNESYDENNMLYNKGNNNVYSHSIVEKEEIAHEEDRKMLSELLHILFEEGICRINSFNAKDLLLFSSAASILFLSKCVYAFSADIHRVHRAIIRRIRILLELQNNMLNYLACAPLNSTHKNITNNLINHNNNINAINNVDNNKKNVKINHVNNNSSRSSFSSPVYKSIQTNNLNTSHKISSASCHLLHSSSLSSANLVASSELRTIDNFIDSDFPSRTSSWSSFSAFSSVAFSSTPNYSSCTSSFPLLSFVPTSSISPLSLNPTLSLQNNKINFFKPYELGFLLWRVSQGKSLRMNFLDFVLSEIDKKEKNNLYQQISLPTIVHILTACVLSKILVEKFIVKFIQKAALFIKNYNSSFCEIDDSSPSFTSAYDTENQSFGYHANDDINSNSSLVFSFSSSFPSSFSSNNDRDNFYYLSDYYCCGKNSCSTYYNSNNNVYDKKIRDKLSANFSGQKAKNIIVNDNENRNIKINSLLTNTNFRNNIANNSDFTKISMCITSPLFSYVTGLIWSCAYLCILSYDLIAELIDSVYIQLLQFSCLRENSKFKMNKLDTNNNNSNNLFAKSMHEKKKCKNNQFYELNDSLYGNVNNYSNFLDQSDENYSVCNKCKKIFLQKKSQHHHLSVRATDEEKEKTCTKFYENENKESTQDYIRESISFMNTYNDNSVNYNDSLDKFNIEGGKLETNRNRGTLEEKQRKQKKQQLKEDKDDDGDENKKKFLQMRKTLIDINELEINEDKEQEIHNFAWGLSVLGLNLYKYCYLDHPYCLHTLNYSEKGNNYHNSNFIYFDNSGKNSNKSSINKEAYSDRYNFSCNNNDYNIINNENDNYKNNTYDYNTCGNENICSNINNCNTNNYTYNNNSNSDHFCANNQMKKNQFFKIMKATRSCFYAREICQVFIHFFFLYAQYTEKTFVCIHVNFCVCEYAYVRL